MPEAFTAVFDFETFVAAHPEREVRPRGAIAVRDDPAANAAVVDQYLHGQRQGVVHAPYGLLERPYLMPGGPYDQLWDWDAFFTWAGAAELLDEPARGSLRLLLSKVDDQGRAPRLIAHDKAKYNSLPLPLLAQWTLLLHRRGQLADLQTLWPRLEAVRNFYDRSCAGRHGLYRLPTFKGNGFDNDPVLYGKHEVGAVHVNCLHYRELQAMATLAGLCQPSRHEVYTERALHLRQAISDYHYDPVCKMFFHLDLADIEGVEAQPRTWELPYRWATSACLWPLWTGVASQAQAQSLAVWLLDENRFLSVAGIRSLDARERMYNNNASGAPSNWQGPVWAQTTVLACLGLARYGFREAATDIARRLIAHLAADIRANGCVHENYHGDSGQPLIHPGFLSWNFLAYRLEEQLNAGTHPLLQPLS